MAARGRTNLLHSLSRDNQIFRRSQQALDDQDANAIDALIAKGDALEQQLGPEYDAVIEGLEQIDFNTAEGQQIAACIDREQIGFGRRK